MDIKWMRIAIEQARIAQKIGEIPVGAVIIYNDNLIGYGYNNQKTKLSPICHAEINALKKALSVSNSLYLSECIIYVTLEPCMMCLGALKNTRIGKLVFAASRENFEYNCFKDKFNIKSGILMEESIDLLKNFFRNLRKENKTYEQ